MNTRITHYTDDGTLKPFTQPQADEIGGVLLPEGIALMSASKLVAMWNRRAKRERYGLPEDIKPLEC